MNFVPDPSGPFCERSDSRSLKPGARSVRGPALSPGMPLKLFGRLIVVLVASSVPVIAGCGRPESATSLSSDCSRFAFGVFSSDCAVVRSISLITEFKFVCSTFGLSGKTSRVSSGMAAVECTSCNSLSKDFWSSGSCTSVWSGFGLAASVGRARCRLVERFWGGLDALHLERRRRSFLQPERRGWLKAGPIEEKAKHRMQREGNDEPDKQPVALLAPARPDGQRRGSSCGHGIHAESDKRRAKMFVKLAPDLGRTPRRARLCRAGGKPPSCSRACSRLDGISPTRETHVSNKPIRASGR